MATMSSRCGGVSSHGLTRESCSNPVTKRADGGEDHGQLAVLLESLLPGKAASKVVMLSYWRRRVWTVPHSPALNFIGRDALLETVDSELEHHPVVALIGMPGVGKTELAVQIASRWYGSNRVANVFWCRAENEEQLTADLAAAAKWPFIDADFGDDTTALRRAMPAERWLAQQDDWLLVLDNVERIETVDRFLPRDPTKHVLITTRSVAVTGTIPAIAVPPLSATDSSALLMAHGARPPAQQIVRRQRRSRQLWGASAGAGDRRPLDR